MGVFKLGKDGVLLIGPDTAATPTVEVSAIKEPDITLSMAEDDTSTRSEAVETAEPTLAQLGVSFDIRNDGNEAYALLESSFWGRTAVRVHILDSPGGNGIAVTCKVFTFKPAQPLKGIQVTNVSLKPCVGAKFRRITAGTEVEANNG